MTRRIEHMRDDAIVVALFVTHRHGSHQPMRKHLVRNEKHERKKEIVERHPLVIAVMINFTGFFVHGISTVDETGVMYEVCRNSCSVGITYDRVAEELSTHAEYERQNEKLLDIAVIQPTDERGRRKFGRCRRRSDKSKQVRQGKHA